MSDLTDFVLARIDEDEAAVDATGTFGKPGRNGYAGMADVRLIRQDYDEMLIGPARVLAECEAKRQIVEVARLFGCEKVVTHYLALPYADHPDYREEWRV